MSKRLQVLLSDSEMAEIRDWARREQMTEREWVRRVIREASSHALIHDRQAKLKAVRKAIKFSFPIADMDQMLQEIEQGYHK